MLSLAVLPTRGAAGGCGNKSGAINCAVQEILVNGSCNDGDACTTGDTCVDGGCNGTQLSTPACMSGGGG